MNDDDNVSTVKNISRQYWSLSDEERRSSVIASNLYSPQIMHHQWPIVYHPNYDISFFGIEKCHPFDAGKWGRIVSFLAESEPTLFPSNSIVRPLEASRRDLLVVHTENYLLSLCCPCVVAAIVEVPFVAFFPCCLIDRFALRSFRFHTGGTILAAKLALKKNWAINIGGGFHHCSKNRGGGFCIYADITLSLEFLFLQDLISKVMIVDLDAHQGNGHERDYIDDDRVYIFDMYNSQIYPGDFDARAGINCSVQLSIGTGDSLYLHELSGNLESALGQFHPDLLFYNAGTDCLAGDWLGQLDISPNGIIKRDELVFTLANRRRIPIVMVTSGGYQRSNARIIADSILNLYQKRLIQRYD